jgi:hypothetical protein
VQHQLIPVRDNEGMLIANVAGTTAEAILETDWAERRGLNRLRFIRLRFSWHDPPRGIPEIEEMRRLLGDAHVSRQLKALDRRPTWRGR